ncbi:MAG: hypothetical protein ACYCV5_06340 [Acidimicrobiales bacterium]
MPWCEECDERIEEEDLTEEGTCPVCGFEPIEHRKSPWYFKFMVVATVIYVIFRIVQGILWLSHHL